jgi:hypothetical protein
VIPLAQIAGNRYSRKEITMNDYSLLEITASLDQPIPFEAADILSQVDVVVNKALEARDPEIGLNAGATLIKANRLAGLGIAKLSFQLQDRWAEFEIEDNFFDRASLYWQLSRPTIERYTRVWKMLVTEDIPEEIGDRLQQRPMKDLIAIANMVAQGVDVPDPMWEVLAEAPNNATVLAEIRDIKGVEPKTGSMIIHMERDGTLKAWKNGEGIYIGYLAIAEDGAEKAINRIIDKVGIVVE